MKENFILILPPSHSLSWTWCYILCSIYHYLKLPYQPFSSFITSTFPLKVETLLVLFTAESQVLKMVPQHDKHLTYWLSEYGALPQNSSCWQRFQEAAPGVGPRSRPGQVLHCSHKWKPRTAGCFYSITDNCSQTRKPGFGKAQKNKYSKRNAGTSSKNEVTI